MNQRGVFLDRDSLDRQDLDFTPLDMCLTHIQYYAASSLNDVQARLANAEVVLVNKFLLTAALLDQAPHLQLINVAATGTNNVDLPAARQRGITVCNCQGYGTASVVQHVFGLILALTTRLLDYHQVVKNGGWQQASQFCLLNFPIRELNGKTLGIIGYGELGRSVAHVAHAFGMRVLIAQRPGTTEIPDGRLPLSELLPQVDILTLHCPLTPQTRHLIGTAELALMRPTALLINAARGGIVDEMALAAALRAGDLAGAGVDVLSEEPPQQGNPLLADDIPHLIVTPHCAWGSREARQRVVHQLAENIVAFYKGQPRRVVN